MDGAASEHVRADADGGVLSSTQAIKGALRSTPFRRLWYATALSSLGDWLGLLATTALAASLATGYDAQNYALGGVLVVRLLPSVVLGPLAGVWADRFDRRLTMVASDVLRFLLFLSIPIVRDLTALFIASFLIECVSLFFNPAKDASVPNLVRRNQIEAANQLGLITTYGLTPVLAAALFSGLALLSERLADSVTFFGTNEVALALYFNAGTFLVSAMIVWRIKQISGHRDGAGEQPPSLWSLLREGVAFLRSSLLLRGLIVGILGAFAAGGAVIGAGRTYVSSLGGGDAAYGVLFGAVFVGLGLGIALGPRVARELSRRRLFGLSIMLAGGALVLTAVMPHVVLAVAFVVCVGFGAGVAYLSGMTLLSAEVDDALRGRVFAFIQSLVRVVLILSLAAVPFIVGALGQLHVDTGGLDVVIDGTRIVLVAAGVLALIAGVIAYRNMDVEDGAAVLPDVVASLRRDSTAQRKLHTGGLFIAFEGGEGAGKSMQIQRLAQALRDRDQSVTVTYEPGATPAGKKIRGILLEAAESVAPRAEALLFAADRAHHVETVIRPALDAGGIVLTDRYVDSSLAYQGAGRALAVEDVRRMSRWATGGLVPDLTILLDIDPAIGLARAKGRSAHDLLERESLDFHERVRQAFRALAEAQPRRYLVLDATLRPDDLAAVISATVIGLLAGRSHRAVLRTAAHTPLAASGTTGAS
ncbi:MAG: tmk [Pseudonocardiales bacterium]|nr:tmk [Pseudonocardiales bacterium]